MKYNLVSCSRKNPCSTVLGRWASSKTPPKAIKADDFAWLYGLTMDVHERENPSNDNCRYYASFRGVEIVGNGVLISPYGDGKTPKQAIVNYLKEISNQKLAINTDRRITAPTLKY